MGLLGSIGSIAGGAIGTYFGGPAGGSIGASIGSGLGNFISGAANSAISYHYDMKQAKDLAKFNMELQKELNEYNSLNRYPWAVKSLRDAGLNPILAATQGAPLSGGSVQAQAINAKRGQDIINTATALGQLDNLEAQNKNLKAQNDFIKAQTLAQVQSAKEIQERVKSLQRDNTFWDSHKDVYEVHKFGSMPGIVGQVMAGGRMLDAMTPPFTFGSKASKDVFKNYRYEDSY